MTDKLKPVAEMTSLELAAEVAAWTPETAYAPNPESEATMTTHELTMEYTPAGSPADVADGFSESCSCGWSGVWRHGGPGARTWAIEDGDLHLNRAAYAQIMRNIGDR